MRRNFWLFLPHVATRPDTNDAANVCSWGRQTQEDDDFFLHALIIYQRWDEKHPNATVSNITDVHVFLLRILEEVHLWKCL